MGENRKAVVLLSGGQDSTTCLGWALLRSLDVTTVFFDYGQRHVTMELGAAKEVCRRMKVRQPLIQILRFAGVNSDLLRVSQEAFTRDGGLPSSFVPGRNAVFMAVASGIAKSIGAETVVTGICQTDYSGYPDCREDFRAQQEAALRLGLEMPGLRILAPLMFLTKAETWSLAHLCGCLDVVREVSHTCYQGVPGGCGECPACVIRERGYEAWQSAGIVHGQRVAKIADGEGLA